MNDDDPSLKFIAGVLSSCLYHGGVSDKQADAVNTVLERVIIKYEAGELDCQFDPSDDGRELTEPKTTTERVH